MAVSAGEAIREYRVFLAQDALDALDAWTTAYERAEYLESVRRTTPDRTLVKFDAVPPNFDELITRSMLRGVAVEAGVTVAGLVTLVPKNSVSLYLFPHRFKGYYDFGQALSRLRSGSQAASSATRRLGTKLAAKIVSEVAKTSARAVAKAVLSTGPQIVIGLAISNDIHGRAYCRFR
ncbi:hypothetical protein [Candidatus Reidiella endopervernicosa]|uniref:Uncharacterized protein n=1 Tax=Candidatus Reidiella endopervernicosa TaxID=2738883 RepID=A0A6N0HWY8_9GAMM|nr:hypothetical protein [Candidatus Reidiella endopervernicosa]QKQ26888.1 hypothetical protein HUE57_11825 [Candidatus Reidiella endopervernicosa]